MEKKTFIDKIKQLFSEVENEKVNEEVKMIETTTKDGIILKTETDFVEGAEVMIVVEGEDILASSGDYETEDKIYTVVDGIITDITDVETETETEDKLEEEFKEESKAKDEEKLEEEVEEENGTSGEVDTEIEVDTDTEVELEDTKFLELEDRIKKMEQMIVDLTENMSIVEKLSSVVSSIADLPSDVEIKLSKAKNSNSEKITNKEERLNFFSKRK